MYSERGLHITALRHPKGFDWLNAVKVKELSARLDEMLKAQADYSREYRVDGGWKAAVERFRNERELTREMAEAFVDKVLVYEDGSVRVHLKYDKELKDLLSLGTEREAV